jgi:prepilin-type N-terminal cleavage/methylation domain-containing protein/prepilin-type processing-associated H-X9-DG protein
MLNLHNATSDAWSKNPSCMSHKRRGFTLIELLVVIAIIALLVSILLPSLQKAKELAKSAMCMSQMRGTGLAVGFYINDSDGKFPIPYNPNSPGTMWSRELILGEYVETVYAIMCPSASPADVEVASDLLSYFEYLTYAMCGYDRYAGRGIYRPGNGGPFDPYDYLRQNECWNTSQSEIVIDSIIMGTSRPTWVYNGSPFSIPNDVQTANLSKPSSNWPDGGSRVDFRHLQRTNILFIDFHVETADEEIEIVRKAWDKSVGTGELWTYYCVEGVE